MTSKTVLGPSGLVNKENPKHFRCAQNTVKMPDVSPGCLLEYLLHALPSATLSLSALDEGTL